MNMDEYDCVQMFINMDRYDYVWIGDKHGYQYRWNDMDGYLGI